MYMKKMIETIKNFFSENEWKYNFDENNNVFVSGINMGNVIGNIKMYILMEETSYTVYMILNNIAEEKNYSEVSEFLHRANCGLKNGNFEIDYRDGEIRYKTFVNFANTDISKEVIEESLFIGATMIQQYGKGLLKVMLGEGNPEKCIEECEKGDRDEEI